VTKLLVAAAAGALLALGGCGGDDSASQAKPGPKAVKVSIDTEQFAATRGEFAELEGTVAPSDATVEVDGLTADVSGGTWTARVKLDEVGENEIEVVAAVPGRPDATAKTVLVRERTRAEVAAARDRRARAAARQVSVPSVVGERLDVARVHLNDAGLRVRIVGGGTFGVIVEDNWTVCATEPGAGGAAEKGDRVRVIVDRAC
jgi:hypothetical protein